MKVYLRQMVAIFIFLPVTLWLAKEALLYHKTAHPISLLVVSGLGLFFCCAFLDLFVPKQNKIPYLIKKECEQKK